MKARMKSPALVLPGGVETLLALGGPAESSGLSRSLRELVNLRAAQINGCAVCIDIHSRALDKLGEPKHRIFSVAGWREAPYYTDAERAALALAEAGTRLSDHPEAVSDEIWSEAARHFDEKELAGLVWSIAAINLWTRLNAITGQVSGEWTAQYA